MKVALVGIGKIALDQHVPAIAASPDWELAATVSRKGRVEGVDSFTDFAAFLGTRPDVGVVSLCMPPVPRYDYAEAALLAGRHVMLEKPPGATLAEVHALLSQNLFSVANDMRHCAFDLLYGQWQHRVRRLAKIDPVRYQPMMKLLEWHLVRGRSRRAPGR